MNSSSVSRSRWWYAAFMVSAVAAGLAWRSRMLSLPEFYFKYGGDALWALLVFFGFGFLLIRSSTLRIALIALGFSWVVELTQLYHAPWIDSVRETRIGHLVLGATFNWPDLIAYAAGVSLGWLLEIALLRWVVVSPPLPSDHVR